VGVGQAIKANSGGGGSTRGVLSGNGGNPIKPSNNNSNDGGNNAARNSNITQARYLPNGMQYSIPFYDKPILLGLTSTNVKQLFQEDSLTPNDFATFLNQAALNRMLSSNYYGLNKFSVVKQQKFRAFHWWLSRPFGCQHIGFIWCKALVATLANEGSSVLMHECDGYDKGAKDLGMTLPTFKGDQSGWKLWNNKI